MWPASWTRLDCAHADSAPDKDTLADRNAGPDGDAHSDSYTDPHSANTCTYADADAPSTR